MNLPAGSIKLTRAGIVVSGPWGNDLPLSALGDGYRAMFALIADLFGWAMFMEEDAPEPRDMSGVVLIDELDQHLHPNWQRRIIRLLARHFPNLQFLVTTHSPAMTLGTTDLADDLCQIYLLHYDEEKGAVAIELEAPRGKGIDQILTSALFDMFETSDDETRAQILGYASLAQATDSDSNRSTREELRAILTDRLRSGGSELENIVRQAVREAIDRQFKNKLAEGMLERLKEAAEFESQRQISDLDQEPDQS